jgi:hypothetical protein
MYIGGMKHLGLEDVSMKRILRRRPEDWLKVALPGTTVTSMSDMPEDFVAKIKNESRTDNLRIVNDELGYSFAPLS